MIIAKRSLCLPAPLGRSSPRSPEPTFRKESPGERSRLATASAYKEGWDLNFSEQPAYFATARSLCGLFLHLVLLQSDWPNPKITPGFMHARHSNTVQTFSDLLSRHHTTPLRKSWKCSVAMPAKQHMKVPKSDLNVANRANRLFGTDFCCQATGASSYTSTTRCCGTLSIDSIGCRFKLQALYTVSDSCICGNKDRTALCL